MQTVELSVSGMMCGACQGHVTRALQNVAGVSEVEVDLAAGRAQVRGEQLPVDALIAAVDEEGYSAQVLASGA